MDFTLQLIPNTFHLSCRNCNKSQLLRFSWEMNLSQLRLTMVILLLGNWEPILFLLKLWSIRYDGRGTCSGVFFFFRAIIKNIEYRTIWQNLSSLGGNWVLSRVKPTEETEDSPASLPPRPFPFIRPGDSMAVEIHCHFLVDLTLMLPLLCILYLI